MTPEPSPDRSPEASPPPTSRPLLPSGAADLLTITLATSIIMWAAAYVILSPLLDLEGGGRAIMAIVSGLLMFAAGGYLGARTPRSAAGGATLGLMIGVVNLLLVASLPNESRDMVQLISWIAGFTVIAVILCTVGALAGRLFEFVDGEYEQLASERRNWSARLALVVAIAVFPLILSGGIVTGREAGLAVPDWLTTFGTPMMFFPMVSMQGDADVYAEHFHRLWGLLVGVSTITLFVHLRMRGSVYTLFALMILLAVIAQGVMGGLRVVERGVAWAVVHGVFGQCVFAGMAVLAAAIAGEGRTTRAGPEASGSRRAAMIFLLALLVQLSLGAAYRHLHPDAAVETGTKHMILGVHILGALAVTGIAVFASVRAAGTARKHPDAVAAPGLLRTARLIPWIILTQLGLGIAAAIAVLVRDPIAEPEIPKVEVLITTGHQATGALLLVAAGLLVWFSRVRPSGAAADHQDRGRS